jgi:deazaflavin-dependent oxidoreductase (nitroreductase family)
MGRFLFRFFTGAHAKIIKLSRGKLLAGRLLVLSHKGAKSGKVRDTPLMYFPSGDNYLIIASAGGAPNHPGWYHNLLANPDTVVEVAGKQIAVTARDAGPARDELWAEISTEEPRFAAYETRAERTIPIVVLEPR